MRSAGKISLALAAAVLAAPAGAQAAYAPQLELTLDPATPLAAPAITGTVTQASGETATKKFTLSTPTEFRPNLTVNVASCSTADEQAWTCPEASRIGNASADANGVALSGPVHLSTEGGTMRMLVFLSGLSGVVKQELVGSLVVRADGGFDTVFDNLPNMQVQRITLALLGGDRSLVQNPRRCGTYTARADWESQQAEHASAEVPLTISGCAAGGGGADSPGSGGGGGGAGSTGDGDDPGNDGGGRTDRGDPGGPVVSAVSFAPRRLRAGRRAILRWRLSEATAGTRIEVERRVGRRWRRAGRLKGRGARGANRLTFAGRIGRRRLRPGRYRFALSTRSRAGLDSGVAYASFTLQARR